MLIYLLQLRSEEFLERVKPKENLKMKNSGSGLGSYAKPVEASGI